MRYARIFTALLILPSVSLVAAETVLIENGSPRAEIVVAGERPRMVTLATLELQHFLEKISGARLPIVTAPTSAKTIKIHVGQSAATARANAPTAVAGGDLAKADAYTLKDNMTLKKPPVETTFRTSWDDDAILFDIVCREPEMKKLRVSSDVFSGDNVIILLETPLHSPYYYLEINPDGAIAEGNPGKNWHSLAEVKTERGSDFWRVRVRIPVVGETETQSDPRHRVAGSKPTAKEPWYFNVGRYRVLDFKKLELQAFSPTRAGWHVPEKFGKLWVE